MNHSRISKVVYASMLSACLSIVPSVAQNSETVAIQFLSFPRSMDPKPVELLLDGGETLVVSAPSNVVSPVYNVKRQDSWSVGETAINDDGKQYFNLFGRSQAISSQNQLILLVRKGPENLDGMDVIPIDNNINNFGEGMFLFMNAATVDIAGEAGGVKFAIKPGSRQIVTPKADRTGRTFHAMFYFRKDDEARPFFSSKWPINENARALIFFYHDPLTKNLRMHSIQDFF